VIGGSNLFTGHIDYLAAMTVRHAVMRFVMQLCNATFLTTCVYRKPHPY